MFCTTIEIYLRKLSTWKIAINIRALTYYEICSFVVQIFMKGKFIEKLLIHLVSNLNICFFFFLLPRVVMDGEGSVRGWTCCVMSNHVRLFCVVEIDFFLACASK